MKESGNEGYRVPEHVAVILDGNGRWARERGFPRTYGHIKGAEKVRSAIKAAAGMGIKILTLYVFSRENWKRPAGEVAALMRLLMDYLAREAHLFQAHGIRLKVIGDRAGLPASLEREISKQISQTAHNKNFTLILAINYSGREEILQAARHLVAEAKNPGLARDGIQECQMAGYLDTAGIPDPQILIRTGGEQRFSNFLTWQAAHSFLVFLEKMWPDFTAQDLKTAINRYNNQQRRSI